jgi:hypothetical protein
LLSLAVTMAYATAQATSDKCYALAFSSGD